MLYTESIFFRYFGKPGRESFFARYHWLAEQYRKLCLPGQETEFVFENLDDPQEQYFFSRGDADVEDKLGNESSLLIAEFESKFVKSSLHDDGSDSDGTLPSQLDSPVVQRKDSRQLSFDSWPSTPKDDGPPTPVGAGPTMFPSFNRKPSLQSFSEAPLEPEDPSVDADTALTKSPAKSPWDDEGHRKTASRYSLHAKSRSAMSMSRSMSNIPVARSMPAIPSFGPNAFKHKQLDSWGLSMSSSFMDTPPVSLASAVVGKQESVLEEGRELERQESKAATTKSPGSLPALVSKTSQLSVAPGGEETEVENAPKTSKLPSLTQKRSSLLNLPQVSSFQMSLSSSKKRTIPDAEFFTSEFIGDCNGIHAPASPRSRYVMACLSKGLTPKASLIVRKMLTRSLDLQHKGIGDEMAALLAESLKAMPCLERVNLEDNNLSDEGMGPILQALSHVTSLRSLNLASNEIGGVAAEELGNYLVRDDCPLQTLTLHHADVDDFEGERFVNALASNTSLTEVDLSFNKIGSAENLNTVYPDLTTATEAMAELLVLPTCPLRILKLTWNMMRLDSAVQFSQALAVNESLTYLDVSYNAFGNDAGCALGDALLDNKTIKTLLISNNGLDSKACFTICIGIQENLGLTRCNMDGNPIGEAGAKALMVLPSVVGTRVNVSANNCNTNIRDPSFWFDQNYPCAEYELHLNDPFERAVCYMLLGLVACHQTLIMTRVFLETPGERGQKKVEKLDLIQETFTDKCKYLDDSQLAILHNLYSLEAAANNTEEAVALFHKYDADESGALDKDELKLVLADFGMVVDDDKIDDFIQTYDVDGEGLIELPEFLSFVKSQQLEAAMRVRDMTENMGMVIMMSYM